MPKKLIIAEKPSLARNIVAGVEKISPKMKTCSGYYENDEYIVTYAYGHLFGLQDLDKYADFVPSEDKGWSLKGLPYFPKEFKYVINSGKDDGPRVQFNRIAALMNRPDVNVVINAGDADREGEIIVRNVVVEALALPEFDKKKKLSYYRLWLPDQTPATVAAGLKDLKPESDYDSLANEGYARTFIDWLYGINLTRYATVKSGSFLRVGRVIVPIVKAIYDRDMAIERFVPETYYGVASKEKTKGEVVELTSKKTFKKKPDGEKYAALLNAQKAVVTDKKSKKDTISPGKLYSLSKLQSYLGKKYGMSMEYSLTVVQSLYEKGFLTYPRTNTEYLATAEKEKIKGIISLLQKNGRPVKFKDGKTIFDDSKIESHSALTPTTVLPDLIRLSADERKVYESVLNRFIAVFCSEECKATKTELTVVVGKVETFTVKGVVIEAKGWTAYDDSVKQSEKVIPSLNVGDAVEVKFKTVEKTTSPPKHYTIETLNNYLKNPFREDKKSDDDTEEYKAIFEGLELGTEATRSGIIANAVKSEYIALKKNTYTILPGGKNLIENLVRLGISMDKYKTSETGKALKAVYRGEMTVKNAVELAEKEITEVFNSDANNPESEKYVQNAGTVIGKCPKCGKDFIKGRFNYGCVDYRECGCKVPFTLCGVDIPLAEVKKIIGGETSDVFHFTSKAGKEFSAALKFNDKFEMEFVFDDDNTDKVAIGECPRCGRKVVAGKYGYSCEDYKNCAVRIPYHLCNVDIDVETAQKLLKEGRTQDILFMSKKGNPFTARLVFDEDYKVVFEFPEKN